MSNKATAPIIPVNKTGWFYDYGVKKFDQILPLPGRDIYHIIQFEDDEDEDTFERIENAEIFDTREECEQAHEMSNSLYEAKKESAIKDVLDSIKKLNGNHDVGVYDINLFIDDHEEDYDFRLMSKSSFEALSKYREAINMLKKRAIVKRFTKDGKTNIPFESIDRVSNKNEEVTIVTKDGQKYCISKKNDDAAYHAICLIFDID